ncbi:hypothetical protein LshimejAT787_1101890 [Lyophyllum shimeji]|uniref:Uncharacterized protein n=1 Tax=Lyophyllum shimeji TaxID=47721 RepID=A0A9P3UP00_LYOSH|nr:hypothetical protein LshimejAT787_1101890 [Lyophyllum shimeji]
MKTTGTGSKHSPISIDDSEDEVVQELVGQSCLDSNTSSPNQLLTGDSRNKRPGNLMAVGQYLHAGPDGKRPQKRKRATNDLQSGPVAGPSQPRHPLPNQPAAAPMSKKARKRQRRLERQALDTETRSSKHQAWANGVHYLPPDLTPSQMLQSWPTKGNGLGDPRVQVELPGSLPPYGVPLHIVQARYPAQSQSVSSSAWVASMARAAETPAQEAPSPLEPYPFVPKWPDFHQSSPPPAPQHTKPPLALWAARPTQIKPAESLSLPDHPPAPAPPPAPPPIQTIGMKPEQDPSSKHGLYQIPPGAPSPTGNAAPYIPNPARTLVMEQLPKSHRTTDFVNSWSKSASGAYPVYVHVDPPAARALIEFATAELARKAWSSPRLGAALVGLKTNQLKGRPREDLIKVWWYRVDGVGANAGVGEIEEGEIEGDAAEKEVEVPVKKETKKERKARLAKERQAKQKVLQQAKAKAAPLQTPTQTTAVVTPPETSIPNGLLAAPPLPLPPNPTLLSHGFPYYPAMPIPQAPSHPLPHHRPHLHPQAAAESSHLPQSAFAAQSRPKHELPRRPAAHILHEQVASRNALAQNGTISSTIASSRSPSSSQLSPEFIIPQVTIPKKSKASPDHGDITVDDDMDLESPQAKRAQFDFSLPAAPLKGVSPSLLSLAPSAVRAGAARDVDHTVDVTAVNNSGGTSITEVSPTVLLDPVPPPVSSITPPSTSDTLPLEARAMRDGTKDTPKGPSHAKRSLLVRQKALAERIAQTKRELGLISTPTSDPSVPTIDVSIPRTASPVPSGAEERSDKQAMEDRLRSLVLKSQRNKGKTSVSPTLSRSTGTADPSPMSPTLTSTATSSSGSAVSSRPAPSTASALGSHSFSLDDLAVSFITETIETIKATPTPTPSTAATESLPTPVATPGTVPLARTNSKLTSGVVTTNSAAAMKLELAAKQKRLEAQIAETKVLMARLEQARTKQERDSILALMRERSRNMADENGGATTGTATAPRAAPTPVPTPKMASHSGNAISNVKSNTRANQAQAQVVKKWPVAYEHAGVLIVSDDEEDDESDPGLRRIRRDRRPAARASSHASKLDVRSVPEGSESAEMSGPRDLGLSRKTLSVICPSRIDCNYRSDWLSDTIVVHECFPEA